MDDKTAVSPQNNHDDDVFYTQVADLLVAARQYAKRQLDRAITAAYYETGRMIVEREQQGHKRARYGAELIKGLSAYLTVNDKLRRTWRRIFQTCDNSINLNIKELIYCAWRQDKQGY